MFVKIVENVGMADVQDTLVQCERVRIDHPDTKTVRVTFNGLEVMTFSKRLIHIFLMTNEGKNIDVIRYN